jgi:hypothetical protein
MTEGEEYIRDYFEEENITYRAEQIIEGLTNDSKAYRRADFYLPKYRVYVEYFGQWNNENHKERYREKRQTYIANKIPCVLLYPENLGILDHVFKKRLLYVLEKYHLEKQLNKFRWKLFFKKRSENVFLFLVGCFLIYITHPWNKERVLTFSGFLIVGYQTYILSKSYKQIFKTHREL